MSGRSHPPTLLRLAERALRDECGVARGDVLLCACSGGPDSTALLHALALLRKTVGHELVAHGVDHGLRAEAAAELGLAAELAARLGVPFAITRVEVAAGSNLQDRARRARHAALAEAAGRAGASAIATGHTADDRAETVLLRLLRGAGPRGLAVLPPRALGIAGTDLVRPLLRARRADIVAHLARHRLPSATDPSNADPRFARVRVRRELLPLMQELSPRVVEHLAALADALSEHGGDDALAGLGRAQRQAIERARRAGRAEVSVRVRGGEDLEVAFPRGRIVLTGRR